MKNFIKSMAIVLAANLLFCTLGACDSGSGGDKIQTVKIGVTAYRKDDTFVASVCTNLEKYAKKKEAESGKKIIVNIVDGQSIQAQQNDQVDRFLAQNYDVICVNMVDRTAAAVIVNKAKAANVPVIFFNREPVEEDIHMWDKAYYVGTDAAESGRLQGGIIVDAFKKDSCEIDKNNDGKIQYVMLEGEQVSQDSLLRTEYSIKAIIEAGIKVEKLANHTANWQHAQGATKMAQWIQKFGDRIEVVFSNNDDMALGAIDAIKESTLKTMPVVVGVDATQPGLNAIKNGTMLGTVVNDAQVQASQIFGLSYAFASGQGVPNTIKLENGHYVRVPHRIVTKDTVEDELDKLMR